MFEEHKTLFTYSAEDPGRERLEWIGNRRRRRRRVSMEEAEWTDGRDEGGETQKFYECLEFFSLPWGWGC